MIQINNGSEEKSMSWKEFQEGSPELAAKGFEKLNRKIAYLATIKKDGSPRLHPIQAFIDGGMLFTFTEPSSPKVRDLCRDGRYALHCSVLFEDQPRIEFLVSGVAEAITDPGVRARAISFVASSDLTDKYFLFNFHVDNVLVVEYDLENNPLPRRWRRGG
jgi:hypothetical protein